MPRLRPSNKQWYRVHGWIGVQLGVLLFAVLFSGTLATVGHELDWLANPAMRVEPAGEPAGYDRIVADVRRAYPDHEVRFLEMPQNPHFALELQLWRPDAADFTDGLRRVYVDPYSGEIQGTTGWFTIQRVLRNFHMNLSLPAFGIYIVGALGFFLLASVTSALLFYKRWWRRLFVLRLHRGRRVLWSDAHRAAGLWSLWLMLVIAITGVWYFVEMGMFDAGVGLGDIPGDHPALTAEALAAHGEDRQPASLDTLLASARRAYPALDVTTVYFPADPARAVRLTGQASAWLVRDRANNVYLDPFDATVMARHAAEDLPLAYRWVHTADPLHFGDFGGLATKLIWLVFGLMASALPLTGAYLWWRRLAREGGRARAALGGAPGQA